MASLREQASKRVEMFMLDPSKITIDPNYNVRQDSPELREHRAAIKASMKANGFLSTEPLVVRMDGEMIILRAGHNRHAAVMELISEGVAFEAVPVIPEPKATTPEERDLDLIQSNSGMPLTALEKGIVFKRLKAHGWSDDQIGEKIGITGKQVRNLLELASAPKEVKDMVVEGTVSATMAIKTLQAEGATKATATLTEAVAEAKAQGKTKATAGTMTGPKSKALSVTAPKGVSYLDAIVSEMGVKPSTTETPPANVPASTNQERNGFVRPRMTSEKFHTFWETLAEAYVMDDIGVIKTMIKDALS